MRIIRLSSALIILAFIPMLAGAQAKYYQHDTTVKVIAYGQQQTLAWCGGFNNPQFTMGDLNHDGLLDLVVFETWNSLKTFINKGTTNHPAYRYAPEYALNFPPIYDYIVLADYNCDGVPDLFHQGSFGFAVYKGYYNVYNQLCFTFYRDLFLTNDGYAGGPENAFNNPGDIPAIVDVDDDGDLDFIAYSIGGGYMWEYKNMRTELGLPCDSIHINLFDRCWGKVYQGLYRTHDLGKVCDNTHLGPKPGRGEKVTHTGNTPCLFDWDMDGDYDYLDGSVSYNEMTFLKNGRVEAGGGPDSMISQDTLWQSNTGGKRVDIATWPAAFNVDIDQDGSKDLLISPNGRGENYNVIWFYKNFTNTAGAPDWRFQSDSFLTDNAIDIGSASYPMYFDYNKDGKPDLFIGSDGYYQKSTGLLRSRISYYKNTSVGTNASFTLQTTDFLSINSYDFKGAAPAFGDIDDDSIADMVIGHTNGSLSYFKNMAANDTAQPNWQLQQLKMTDVAGDTILVDGYAAPFIYDIDKDGKKDLIIGNYYGTLVYYQNVSTAPGTLALKFITKELGHIKVDPKTNFGNLSTPFIGRIDSSGTDYLLMGANSGLIYRFTGFQSGDTTATYTMLDSAFAHIDTFCNAYLDQGTVYGIFSGIRSSVTLADVTGDGNLHMIIGNNKGGVEDYKNKIYVAPPPVNHTGLTNTREIGPVLIYPNPANDVLNVSWSSAAQSSVTISVINMEGQNLISYMAPILTDHTSISTSILPPGMYVCVVQSDGNRYYHKFSIIR